jgi:hypothetical protein
MWNPLTLALGALNAAATLPRVLESVARSADLLERANAQAEELNRRGALVLQERAARIAGSLRRDSADGDGA